MPLLGSQKWNRYLGVGTEINPILNRNDLSALWGQNSEILYYYHGNISYHLPASCNAVHTPSLSCCCRPCGSPDYSDCPNTISLVHMWTMWEPRPLWLCKQHLPHPVGALTTLIIHTLSTSCCCGPCGSPDFSDCPYTISLIQPLTTWEPWLLWLFKHQSPSCRFRPCGNPDYYNRTL